MLIVEFLLMILLLMFFGRDIRKNEQKSQFILWHKKILEGAGWIHSVCSKSDEIKEWDRFSFAWITMELTMYLEIFVTISLRWLQVNHICIITWLLFVVKVSLNMTVSVCIVFSLAASGVRSKTIANRLYVEMVESRLFLYIV